MRDLQEVFQNCIMLMDEIGMDYGMITEVKVNKRAKNRWGQCRHKFVGTDAYGNPKYVNSINISEILLDERVPLEALQNTIIHEILHTCPGCDNHGYEWKRRAMKVRKELGYNIKTCDSSKDKGVSNEVTREYVKPKYIVRCTKCGREVNKQRMCGIVQHPSLWRCGVCHGVFERVM